MGLLSHGGDDGIRTHDPLLAGQVLSQLSYTPIKVVVFFTFLNSHFHEVKISSSTRRRFHPLADFTFDEVKNFIASYARFGRTKWTRTTDLVLIRHAL